MRLERLQKPYQVFFDTVQKNDVLVVPVQEEIKNLKKLHKKLLMHDSIRKYAFN